MQANDRLRALLDVIEESLDEPGLDGTELAGRAYLSRFHFDRLVTAALGEPPGAFRRRLLLERAAHRLATTDEPVTEIALAAGYGSPEAFTRAFRRSYAATPSGFRQRPAEDLVLAAPSGIHFHPPGGLRLPATQRSNAMDVLASMFEHHLNLVGEIIDRTQRVDDTVLDRPIRLPVEGIDDDPTLRGLCDRLVGQLEMWTSAVAGGTAMPPAGEVTTTGLRHRLDDVGARFRTAVIDPIRDGRADETFVDAICDPPETFTYGGVLAHVLTFSAVRRTLAIGALESAGVTDLGSGDPMAFVGGRGNDAADITRNRS